MRVPRMLDRKRLDRKTVGKAEGEARESGKRVPEGRKKVEKLTWCSTIVRRWKVVDGRGEEKRIVRP